MKVKFLPQNVEFEIEKDQSVLSLAHQKGIFIKSICNSLPSCAECRIKIVEGENNVLLPSSKELQLIGSGYFVDRRRLACQVVCFGDIVVDLSEQSEKEKGNLEPTQSSQNFLRKKKSERSMAVTGNLIDEEKDFLFEEESHKEDDM